MNFNKSIIEDIISENFIDIVKDECKSYISDLDSDDISNFFNNSIDSINIDLIGNINIINYDTNKLDDEIEVSGAYEITIHVHGYSNWDEDTILLENSKLNLIMDFVFYQEADDTFSDFEITEIYF